MKKQLFPKEFINSSLENYTFKIGRKSNLIYLLLLCCFFAAIGALPFVKVDIVTSAAGQINTKRSRYQLQSPVSGRISAYDVRENMLVNAGDTLVTFDYSGIEEEQRQLNDKIEELSGFIKDLQVLILIDTQRPVLSTSRFGIAYLQYLVELDKRQLRKRNLKRVYDRNLILLQKKIIAQADFEEIDAQFDDAQADIEIFRRQAVNSWKEKLYGFIDQRRELNLQLSKLDRELQKFTLVAPEKGELQNVTSVKENQFIPGGLMLAELSPDTSLLATCWVPPTDIGLLKVGMPGSFRVDAFDANDWGLLQGVISDISYDAYVLEGQPFFKVQCELKSSFLSLKNGFKGELRKGMTLQGNFKVTSRTLYQLLYDKIDNWVNPHNRS